MSFHAGNLTDGTTWQLELNGTTYSSITPWINVTTHTGTYSVSAGAAVSANGSIGYVASGVGPEISVTTGSVVPVSYSPAYKVMIIGSSGGSVTPQGVNWYLPGQPTVPLYATPGPDHSFVGWSGTGIGSYNGTTAHPVLKVGGPIIETASFVSLPLDRFDLNFTEMGIPSGVPWQVDVRGTPYSSTGTQLVVPSLDAAPDSYAFSVPYAYGTDPTNATRYLPAPGSGNVYAGTNFNNTLVYLTQHYLTLESTAGGTADVGYGVAGESRWFTADVAVSLDASAYLGYTFGGWVGTGPDSYTGTNASALIAPSGSVTELATFVETPVTPMPTYAIVFNLARPVVPGTDWMVTIGSATYASTGGELNVTGLSAGTVTAKVSVSYSPDGLTQYTPQNGSVTIQVASKLAPVDVTFATSYWVYVTTAGPGRISAGSNWIAAGQVLSIEASPSDGGTLSSWNGTGVGSYTGNRAFANFTVGGPITEVAWFLAAPVAPEGSSTSSSFWNSQTGVGVLAVLGLVVGAMLGLLCVRERSRRPPTGSGMSQMDYPEGDTGGGDAGTPTPPSVMSIRDVPQRRTAPDCTSGAIVLGVVALTAIMLLGGFAGITLAGSSSATAPSSRPTTTTPFSVHTPSSPSPILGEGTFWTNAPMPNVTDHNVCLGVNYSLSPYQPVCGPTNITNEPSLNLSSDGVLVAAYTAYTNWTPCEAQYPLLQNYTYTQIGIATSTDGGTEWSSAQYLGNTVCTNATDADNYVDAWQPSVTSLANGTLVVAFVEFNLSYPTGCGSCYYPFPSIYFNNNGNGLPDYNSSQLVVAFSYDNGATWTAPAPVNTSTVGGSYCSSGCQTYANWIQERPSITAFGQTIYLTWTNITGGLFTGFPLYCLLLGVFCPSDESAVQLAVSFNGTANFSAPIQLPVNVTPGSGFWVAANPSALVTPNGTLVVAYMSNLSTNTTGPTSYGCPYGSCGGFLSDVMVAHSSDNGTSWFAGAAVTSVYDSQDFENYWATYSPFFSGGEAQDYVNAGDEILPAPKATYDPYSEQVVLAFTADLAFRYCTPSYASFNPPCESFATPDVYEANGSLASNTWSSRLVTAWSDLANSTPNGLVDSYFYNPAIVSTGNGTIYLTAQFVNGSACMNISADSYLGKLNG
ncbi:MAG: glycoside hydrolase, partial [Thermoplasmata archaeon]|nr:glycoside hydrolase [Thermoplasmata archaeon]